MSGIKVVALISVCLICYRLETDSGAYKLSTVNLSTIGSIYNHNSRLSKGRYTNRHKEGIKYYSDSFPNVVDVTQNELTKYRYNIVCNKVPNEKTNSAFCGSKLQESILDHTMIPVYDENKDTNYTSFDDKPELRCHSQHHADETENVYSASEKEESGITTSQALTNIVMTVEYDGGEYSGFVGPNHFYNEEKAKTLNRVAMPWTKQKGVLKSISNEISRAMAIIHGYIPKSRKKKRTDGEQLTKDMEENNEEDSHFPDTLPPERRFTLIAASRTDKGVHATETACQYLSFDKEAPYNGDIDAIMDKLNRLLPDDVRVSAMIHAPTSDFHVRFDNLGKHYTYKVDISESPNIFERKYYWQIMKDSQFRNTLMKKYNDVRQHFSFESMQKGADVIQGTHNFEGFRKKSRGNEKALIKDPICTIERIDIKRDRDDPENKFHIAVYGNRFLYKMVRGIVSHLVMVAYGILTPRDIQRILETGEALPEIQYAPCNGLYLSKVIFASEVEALLSASKERRINYLKELYKPSNTIEPNVAI